jgi:dethiobiotin synthetase
MSADRTLPMVSRGTFVTGTDTGVGKTVVSCAMIHAIASAGCRVVGMKPVAAGAQSGETGLRNDDVERLTAASNVKAPRMYVNPYCFEPPVAPHIAARAAGVSIDIENIVLAFQQLAASADWIVVEGIGGLCVPLNAREDTADLAWRLGLPVVLVVGVRLGCINHALLTLHALRSRGLTLAGWFANHIDPVMTCADENVAALAERFDAPLLGRIDYAAAPAARVIAANMNLTSLGIPAPRPLLPVSTAHASQ